MTKFDDHEFEVKHLNLRPGDILVLRFKERLSMDTVSRMREIINPIIQPNKCLVLEMGGDLAVLTREEIESRSTTTI